MLHNYYARRLRNGKCSSSEKFTFVLLNKLKYKVELTLLIIFLYHSIFLAFISVYYSDKVSPTGILLVFLYFSERFQDPVALPLADRISERNSQIPLVLRGTVNL
jgi:hypothetical protein